MKVFSIDSVMNIEKWEQIFLSISQTMDGLIITQVISSIFRPQFSGRLKTAYPHITRTAGRISTTNKNELIRSVAGEMKDVSRKVVAALVHASIEPVAERLEQNRVFSIDRRCICKAEDMR